MLNPGGGSFPGGGSLFSGPAVPQALSVPNNIKIKKLFGREYFMLYLLSKSM